MSIGLLTGHLHAGPLTGPGLCQCRGLLRLPRHGPAPGTGTTRAGMATGQAVLSRGVPVLAQRAWPIWPAIIRQYWDVPIPLSQIIGRDAFTIPPNTTNILGETKFSFYLRKAEVKYWNNSIIIGEIEMFWEIVVVYILSNIISSLGKGDCLRCFERHAYTSYIYLWHTSPSYMEFILIFNFKTKYNFYQSTAIIPTMQTS